MEDEALDTFLEQIMTIVSKPPDPQQTADEKWEEHCELRTLVDAVRDRQEGKSVHKWAVGKQEYDGLMAWLADNGVEGTEKVELAAYDTFGTGVKASQALSKGARVLTVPRSVMMTVETAEKSQIGKFVKEDKLVSLMPNVALAVHLLVELHRPNSFWTPYLRCLPASYPTPLTWDLFELSELTGSPTLTEALSIYRHIARQYCYLYNAFRDPTNKSMLPFDFRDFTFDDYCWCVSTVMTRQNQIPASSPSNDGKPAMTLALIPLWDMINHKECPPSTQYNVEKGALEFFAPDNVPSGDQVFMYYGDRSNSDLLLHSGFFYDERADNYVMLLFGVDQQDPLYKIKAKLLTNLSLAVSGDYELSLSDSLEPRLLAFLRVSAMSKDKIAMHLREPARCSKLADPTTPVSADNENRAMDMLTTKCRETLQGYETTIEEDTETLEDGGLTPAMEKATRLRKLEKQILQHTMSVAQAAAAKAH